MPAGPDDPDPGACNDPSGVRVAFATATATGVGTEPAYPGRLQGDCMRALFAKAVMALLARVLAAQRK